MRERKEENTACTEEGYKRNWTLHVGVGREEGHRQRRGSSSKGHLSGVWELCYADVFANWSPSLCLRKTSHCLFQLLCTSCGYISIFIIGGGKKDLARWWGWPSLFGKGWAKGDVQVHSLRFQSIFVWWLNIVHRTKQHTAWSQTNRALNPDSAPHFWPPFFLSFMVAVRIK